jgi:hypothetical protein
MRPIKRLDTVKVVCTDQIQLQYTSQFPGIS